MRKLLSIVILALVLSGCSLPGLGGSVSNDDIVIAAGSTTERQIVAEIIKGMIKHYEPDIKVDTLNNLGSSILIHQALLRKDANISAVMYTGTSITGELGLAPILDSQEALSRVIAGYNSEFNLVWMPTYGFANTYAFMVSREFASEHNITKVSDLKNLNIPLSAGVDTTWIERQGDGYKDFKRIYQFDFDSLHQMDIGLVYSAVSAGSVDIVLGYSTDGRINSYDLVVLEDDLSLFPDYDAAMVIDKQLVKKYPMLIEVFLKLENTIDLIQMQSLNQYSDDEKIDPSYVAKEFLEKHNYFEDIEVIPLEDRDDYKFLKEEMGDSID